MLQASHPTPSPQRRSKDTLYREAYFKAFPHNIIEDKLFSTTLAYQNWASKYRYDNETPLETFKRVAQALASVEKDQEYWYGRFLDMMLKTEEVSPGKYRAVGLKNTFGGRITANAGTAYDGTTLMNCFQGDETLITDDGIYSFKELVNRDKVRVLSEYGTFVDASVLSFGEQSLQRVTLRPAYPHLGGSRTLRGDFSHEVSVTPDHRWILEDGTETTSLKVGDVIKSARYVANPDSPSYKDGFVHGLVFGDGHLTYVRQDGGHSHQLRLCGDKGRYVGLFDNVTYPPSTNGEPLCHVSAPYSYKEVPVGADADYIAGFITGWAAMDGSILNAGRVEVASTDVAALEWLVAHAPYAGYLTTGFRTDYHSTETNYGKRKNLVHRVMLGSNEGIRFKVTDIVQDVGEEEVFCAVVPEGASFTLSGGVYTGNCFINLPPRNATVSYTHKFADGSSYDVSYDTQGTPDSLKNIMLTLLEQAETLKSEGGYGINFGFIRPRGSVVNSLGIKHPGVVSYMEIWDKVAEVIVKGDSDGYQDILKNFLGTSDEDLTQKMKKQARKGAQMAVLPVWHPDVEEFVKAKQEAGRLTKFNLSVLVDDYFMESVVADERYDLWFPEPTPYTFDSEAAFVDIVDGQLVEGSMYSIEDLNEAHSSHADFFADPYGKVWTKKVYKRVNARDLYDLIMKSTYNRAEPGILFYDSMQRNNPVSYISEITSTNPCVVEGTLVATESGLVPVEEVKVGDSIQTMLGFGNVETIERHEDTPVFKVSFTDGTSVTVTEAHIFHSRTGGSNSESRKKWRTDTTLGELSVGDYVRKEPYRFTASNRPELTRDMGLLVGLYLGDGCFSSGKGFNISTDSREDNQHIYSLLERLELPVRTDSGAGNTVRIYAADDNKVKDLFEKVGLVSYDKTNLPIPELVNANKDFAAGLMDGLLSSDGNVNTTGRYAQVRFKNTNREIHELLLHLFRTVGADYKVYLAGTAGEETRIDGRTVTRSKDIYEGIIDNDSILNFYHAVRYLSHPSKNGKLRDVVNTRQLNGVKWASKIASIEPAGTATVYDLYEPESDTWVAGGFVHRGCGEVGGFLTVCLLGNINLTQYVKPDRTFDWNMYKEDVQVFARALDNVNDITKNSLPQYDWATENIRQYGMGINGLGSALLMMGLPFNSEEAKVFTQEAASLKEDLTWRTSAYLAKEKGIFPGFSEKFFETTWYTDFTGISEETKALLRKYGARNGKTTTNAPNGNTSIICDVTSNGIEPIFMLEYNRTYIADSWPKGLTRDNVTSVLQEKEVGGVPVYEGEFAGETYYYEPHNRGLCVIEVVKDYGYGWVQEHFPEDIGTADYFTTTEQLSVTDHVDSLEIVQRNLNQSTSKTVNIPAGYDFEDFKQLYIDGWQRGLNGLTTYVSGSMESVLSKVEDTKEEVSLANVLKDGVVLPDTFINGETSVIKREDAKFYIHFSYHPEDHNKTMPVAMWISSNNTTPLRQVNLAVKEIVELLRRAGINEELIQNTLDKIKEDRDNNRLARAVSMALRHNVPLLYIVDALNKVEDVFVSDLVFAARKFLSSHVEDGTVVMGETCSECGSDNVVFESGCFACKSCGASSCA